MQRVARVVGFVLLVGACGGAGPSSCLEYAADLHDRAATMTTAEVAEYVSATAEDVAQLIAANPDEAAVCADAVQDAFLLTGSDGATFQD